MDVIESVNNLDAEDEFPDAQSRIKGFNRLRPFLQNMAQQRSRVVVNLASRTNFLNKVKTITFTLTSGVTFSSVQSCIPSNHFYVGAADKTCRRKRRANVEDQGSGIESEETQFVITPSDVQS